VNVGEDDRPRKPTVVHINVVMHIIVVPPRDLTLHNRDCISTHSEVPDERARPRNERCRSILNTEKRCIDMCDREDIRKYGEKERAV
jgi:hypothetical protein